jgi:hypothetical protein
MNRVLSRNYAVETADKRKWTQIRNHYGAFEPVVASPFGEEFQTFHSIYFPASSAFIGVHLRLN